jgi:hypothetical protein
MEVSTRLPITDHVFLLTVQGAGPGRKSDSTSSVMPPNPFISEVKGTKRLPFVLEEITVSSVTKDTSYPLCPL